MRSGPDAYPTGRALAGLPRSGALAVVAAGYLVAGLAAWAAWAALPGPGPLHAFRADVAATAVVFLASMALANSSLYDPYWSVAPPVIALCWAVPASTPPTRRVLVLLLILVWAVRLTGNWISGWRGLAHEDWRYVDLRGATRGRLPWWLVSLAGIQLMPTLVVFLGMLPLWPALTIGRRPLGPLDALATLVTAGAIAVEATADRQLRRFTADPAHRDRVADVGLWRHSRHPNYLGEIGFWWGLWLFGVAAAPGWWWTVIGPLTMVLLFTTASVPLMERHSLRRRPGYASYIREVPALLPVPHHRSATPDRPSSDS
jgi:steroid 5-alpha reductase family enzyme